MRVHEGNEIRSDSECVVRAATEPFQGNRQQTADGNADLWAEFAFELRLKTTRRVHIDWVQRHATKKSISTGQRWTKDEMTLPMHRLPLLQHTLQLRRRWSRHQQRHNGRLLLVSLLQRCSLNKVMFCLQ